LSLSPLIFKSAALCLRGFASTPQQVESMIGVTASETGSQGQPVRPGVKTLLKRSFVRVSIQFPDGCRLDEMIPALLARVGGVDHLIETIERVAPEYVEIDLVLPVKGSDEQEGGFLPATTLADLGRLRASLSFQFTG